jgi:hypothetical protein
MFIAQQVIVYTNKHGIDKINITPYIRTNCIIMIYAKLRDRGIENY